MNLPEEMSLKPLQTADAQTISGEDKMKMATFSENFIARLEDDTLQHGNSPPGTKPLSTCVTL
jgi:hypothetical protein